MTPNSCQYLEVAIGHVLVNAVDKELAPLISHCDDVWILKKSGTTTGFSEKCYGQKFWLEICHYFISGIILIFSNWKKNMKKRRSTIMPSLLLGNFVVHLGLWCLACQL